jgi:hypothetical protein
MSHRPWAWRGCRRCGSIRLGHRRQHHPRFPPRRRRKGYPPRPAARTSGRGDSPTRPGGLRTRARKRRAAPGNRVRYQKVARERSAWSTNLVEDEQAHKITRSCLYTPPTQTEPFRASRLHLIDLFPIFSSFFFFSFCSSGHIREALQICLGNQQRGSSRGGKRKPRVLPHLSISISFTLFHSRSPSHPYTHTHVTLIMACLSHCFPSTY